MGAFILRRLFILIPTFLGITLVVFPSHHDPFFPGQKVPDLKKVSSLFERHRGVHFVEPEAGKWYEINTGVKEVPSPHDG